MSAKLKIILSIMGLTVILIMATSFLSWKNFETSSTISYKKQLGYKSQLIADTIGQKINRYFDVLTLVSNELSFTEDGQVDTLRAVKTLQSAMHSTNVINVYFSLADGTSYSSKTNGIIENFNAKTKQREWFLKGMSGQDKIITRPYLATTGDQVMSLAMPIYKQGKIVGVVALNILVEDLSKFTQHLTTNNKIFVTREDGFILAAQSSSVVGKNIFNEIPSFKNRDTSREESFEYVYQNTEFLASAANIKDLGWSVWAWDKESSVNQDSQDNLTETLITSLTLLLICAGCVYYVVEVLVYRPLGGEPSEIEATVAKVASGDFTAINQQQGKAIGINAAVNDMVNELSTTIDMIRSSSNDLFKFAEGITTAADSVNSSSASQMEQLEQTSTAMNEMSVAVDEVAQNAHRASEAAMQAAQEAQSGNQTFDTVSISIVNLSRGIEEVSDVINTVGEKTSSIGTVLDVIKDIADQTNLLALNAAIEAARAGEQGRGFAVVADEVRNLANRTQQSTNQIQEVIVSLQHEANNSMEMMLTNREASDLTMQNAKKAQASLHEISNSITVIEDMNTQIATATEEQTLVAGEINQSIVDVNDKARETHSLSASNQEKASELIALSEKLTQAVSTFKLNR
ncbi:methyl-accepting chemotaxis protein [Vibrio gigantis]|uniref:methyl-accepting chemotaxis protein n=1 Tax=Vibrio TaxID=662 RepID=UPI00255B9BC8|nr:methyl-accepting chemotaxis protein [Vibrio sp. TMPB1044]MDL5026193.1 methyl-accepting chemotaxis protein [Vibrio sp. TMPB1044]MDN5206321.1 methyl-accepting chemotaxis protein [Vibrio sp. TMPB1044]